MKRAIYEDEHVTLLVTDGPLDKDAFERTMGSLLAALQGFLLEKAPEEADAMERAYAAGVAFGAQEQAFGGAIRKKSS
jgi:hypothetical protein